LVKVVQIVQVFILILRVVGLLILKCLVVIMFLLVCFIIFNINVFLLLRVASLDYNFWPDVPWYPWFRGLIVILTDTIILIDAIILS
jgi:hypothetical protein|tara:strand:- start:232 stop:492 length:261 start_codon:yes stop_codon:yes gene_type:complete